MTPDRKSIFQYRCRPWLPALPYILFAPIVLFAGFLGLVYLGVYGPVPGYADLREIRNHEASSVYSADGELIGRYYLQNRDRVALDDITPDFIDALLAIEDIRFYDHNGLDFRAVGRVFVRTILLRQDAGGGSTLSQQLVKNLYPRQGRGLFSIAANKIREIIIAVRMERLYSKKEILELYVNTVSFGEDTWGIKTASERFFNTSPDRLERHQAATLAGMLRATTWYNPRRNPGNALQRRNLVLMQMNRYGMISSEESEKARELPLDLDYIRHSHREGSAPHFREMLRGRLLHILATRPALDNEQYNLYTDGLIIETTIDSRMQAAAEYAVETRLSDLQKMFDRHRNHQPILDENDPMVLWAWQNSERFQRMRQRGASDDDILAALDDATEMELYTWDGMKPVTATPRDSIRHYLSFLNAGFLAMHPASGAVRAWVGGIPHHHFQYDHVRARRQPGSAFKPIVYAAAMESGMEPCDYRRNLLSTYVSFDQWTPTNLQEEYGGRYSMQAALARSVNTIAVEVLMDVGVDNVQETARRMGIRSPIPATPSIALGTAELSLFEMTRAYTAFANSGTPATAHVLTAIYNADGKLIYDFSDQTGSAGTITVGRPSIYPISTSPLHALPSDDYSSSIFPGNEIPAADPWADLFPGSSGVTEQAFSEQTAAAMIGMLSQSVNEGSAAALRSRFGINHALAGKTGTSQNFADGWFIGMTPDLVFGSWVGGASPRVRLPAEFGFASQTALPIAGTFLQEIGKNPDIDPVPEQFHSHQRTAAFNTSCNDYYDERFTDRVRDFLTGRDSQEAQIIEEKDDESRSVIGRIRGWFGGD